MSSQGLEIPVITIDGPSGSGKGAVSRLLADKLGYGLLDSGALYRLLALAAERHRVSLDDVDALVRLAVTLDVRFTTDEAGGECILLEEEDVSLAIRTVDCGNAASILGALPPVREALLQRQRDFLRPPGLVADGRDMGTVVFPQASCKIFLTASLEERTNRRYKQLMDQGISASLVALFDELAKRDERDKNRKVAPLVPAEDAIVIDTTGISLDEVLARVLILAG